MAISNLALPTFQHGLKDLTRFVGDETVVADVDKATSTHHDVGDVLRHLDENFNNLHVRFEPELKTLWCYQNHHDRPCFSMGLLEDVHSLQSTLKTLLDGMAADRLPLRYLVWASSLPGIYNLGGDLSLFCRLIRSADAGGLHDYARRCVDICYLNKTNMDLPIQTVALVQGDALGGGFESVLSNDMILAEEGAKFGLPEVLFNLFPGMGAYSFISRRLDASRARSMIMSGRLYRAEELCDMGLIDLVVPNGSGEHEMRLFIEGSTRKHGMLAALSQVDRRCQPVSHDELMDVADIWVTTALNLCDDDLHRMERLVAAQDRRRRRAR